MVEYSDSPRASPSDRNQIRELLGTDHWIEATLMNRHLDPTDYWIRLKVCINDHGGQLYTFMQSLLWPFGTTFQTCLKEHETMVPYQVLQFTPEDLRKIKDKLVARGKHNKMTRNREVTDRAESPDFGGVSTTLDMESPTAEIHAAVDSVERSQDLMQDAEARLQNANVRLHDAIEDNAISGSSYNHPDAIGVPYTTTTRDRSRSPPPQTMATIDESSTSPVVSLLSKSISNQVVERRSMPTPVVPKLNWPLPTPYEINEFSRIPKADAAFVFEESWTSWEPSTASGRSGNYQAVYGNEPKFSAFPKMPERPWQPTVSKPSNMAPKASSPPPPKSTDGSKASSLSIPEVPVAKCEATETPKCIE